MPLYAALLAALLCVQASSPLLAAGDVERRAPASVRDLIVPSRHGSAGATLPNGPVNLEEFPELVAPDDRTVLLETGYVLKDGFVVIGERTAANAALPPGPLDAPGLRDVLIKLRDKRTRDVLARIHELQRKTLGQGRDKLTPEEAAELTSILKDDWKAVPPDIRGAMNDWLMANDLQPVHGPDLAKAREALKAWDKKGGGLEAAVDPATTYGRALRVQEPPMTPDVAVGRSFFMAAPSRREVKDRIRRVRSARYKDPETGELKPYEPWVREAMEDVVRYASFEEGEDFLRTLEEVKPPIYLSNKDMMPFASGSAHMTSPFDEEEERKKGAYVVMPEFFVELPGSDGKTVRIPHSHPSYYEKLGLSAPDYAAFKDDVRPKRKYKDHGVQVYEYADGSVRKFYPPDNLSGLLLHEVLHLDTFVRKKSGFNNFSNEYRSFTAHNRFWVNREVANGWIGTAAESKNPWAQDPVGFREGLLNGYMSDEVGAIEPDQITVDSQLKRIEEELSLPREKLEAAHRAVMEREWVSKEKNDLAGVNDLLNNNFIDEEEAKKAREHIRGIYEKKRAEFEVDAEEYRAFLLWKKEYLRNDQRLEIMTLQTDYKWHREHGLGYQRREEAKKR